MRSRAGTSLQSYAIVALCLVFAGCAPRDDKLIVPGQRVGPYKLRQPRSQDDGSFVRDYARPISKVVLLSFESECLAVITVASPDYHTEKGLKFGSPTSVVLACYGEPDIRTNGFMVYQKLGVEFHDSNGTVGLINVFERKR